MFNAIKQLIKLVNANSLVVCRGIRQERCMRIISLLLVSALTVGVANAAPPPKMVGIWRMTFAQDGATVIPVAQIEKLLLTVGPDSFVVASEIGHIDAIRGRPGRAWLTRTQGPKAGTKSPILYQIRGDELIMATGTDGVWPKSLKPTGKPGNQVARFKRAI